MHSRYKGIALVELLIVVILISTVATAVWNFHITRERAIQGNTEYSPVDSIADGILDEIALCLRQARPDSRNTTAEAVSVRSDGISDEIEITSGTIRTAYFVDNGNNLVRERKSEMRILLSDVKSLKVTALGSQTLLLTISLKPNDTQTDNPEMARNYFKVATVHATPGNLAQRE